MSLLSRSIHSLVLVSMLPACVSTHVGTPTVVAQVPVKVSCTESPTIQTASVSALTCVLENVGSSWQDLKIKTVRFPDQADVTVVPPEDVRALAQAYELKQSREDNNVGLALTGLVLAGVVVAIGGGDAATRRAGDVAVLGGTAGALGREVKKDYDSAQYGKVVYGEEHLLGGSLRLPPELSLRRQLVINHPTQKPKEIEICWSQPQDVCTRVAL